MKTTSTPASGLSDYEEIDIRSQGRPSTEGAAEDEPYSHAYDHRPAGNPHGSSDYAHLHESKAHKRENDYDRLPVGIGALPVRNGLPAGLRRESTRQAASTSDYEEIDFRHSGASGPAGARADRPESSPYAEIDESLMNQGKLKRQNGMRRREGWSPKSTPPALPPRNGRSVSEE